MADECCRFSFWDSAKDTAKRLLEDPSLAPESVQQARLALCKSCEHLNNGQCDLCGCIVALKVKPNNMRCPAEKWLEN